MNDKDHIPVLLKEVMQYLAPSKGETILDATLGTAGHSVEILKHIGESGHLIGVDQDTRNLGIAREILKNNKNVTLIHGNFRDLNTLIENKVDGILFDLGLHSLHVDDSARGFSFQKEGPLDMRFDPTSQIQTAAMILNHYKYDSLVQIFSGLGQERYSKRIAKAIIDRRKDRPFRTTTELAELIKSRVPQSPSYKSTKRHPATRIFQALRIATNQEFEALEDGLAAAVDLLKEGGRLVVISYHSLEDRIVKVFLRAEAKRGGASMPHEGEDEKPCLEILTKKPIAPQEEEIQNNPRSRSARLRAAIRTSSAPA